MQKRSKSSRALGKKVETLKNAYLHRGAHSIYWTPSVQHKTTAWYVVVLKSEHYLISQRVFYQ